MKTKIIVKTNDFNYRVIIGSNLISNIGKIIKQNSIKFEKCLLIIDKNIPKNNIRLIKRSLRNKKIFLFYIDANEKNKIKKNKYDFKYFTKNEFLRTDCLITIGGGIMRYRCICS